MSATRESNGALIALAQQIADGKVTTRQVQKHLDQIARTYDDPFLPYAPAPKSRPWNREYLQSLCGAVTFGAISREYFLYIAEVADEVYRPQRIKQMVTAVICIAAGIVAIGLLLHAVLARR